MKASLARTLTGICIGLSALSLLVSQNRAVGQASQAKTTAPKPDSVDVAEAKRRGIPPEAVQIEKYLSQIAALQNQQKSTQEELKQTKEELKQTKAMLANLLTENEGLRSEQQTLQAKLDRLLPSDKVANGAVPEVTATQLNTLGEKYDGKTVKMVGVRFSGAANTWVDQLPGISLGSNGLITRVNVQEMQKWIGFSILDNDSKSFSFAFALKGDYGEFLAAMKDDQRINVQGVVVKLTQPGWYGLVCSKIEIAKQVPK